MYQRKLQGAAEKGIGITSSGRRHVPFGSGQPPPRTRAAIPPGRPAPPELVSIRYASCIIRVHHPLENFPTDNTSCSLLLCFRSRQIRPALRNPQRLHGSPLINPFERPVLMTNMMPIFAPTCADRKKILSSRRSLVTR